jgi:hypothetical protein
VQREQKKAGNERQIRRGFHSDYYLLATLDYTKDSSQRERQGHRLELSDSDAAKGHVGHPYVAGEPCGRIRPRFRVSQTELHVYLVLNRIYRRRGT